MFSPWPIYDRVLVNLVDGSAINGLLIHTKGRLLVLNDATLYAEGAEPSPLDGDIYIEREKVLFLQSV